MAHRGPLWSGSSSGTCMTDAQHADATLKTIRDDNKEKKGLATLTALEDAGRPGQDYTLV